MPRRYGTPIRLPGDPSDPLDASPKRYIDVRATRVTSTTPTDQVVGTIWVNPTDETPEVPGVPLTPQSLPRSLAAVVSVTTANTTPLAVALGSFTGPIGLSVTAGHDTGLAVPTGTPDNFQVIRLEVLANAAQRVFAFASGFKTSTGITSRSVTIPVGEVMKATVEYSALSSSWIITAVTVSAA